MALKKCSISFVDTHRPKSAVILGLNLASNDIADLGFAVLGLTVSCLVRLHLLQPVL